jgi:ABC-type dipeptide/oligopeptide/nickel transport system permease component
MVIAIPQLLLITFITFLLQHHMPGDFVDQAMFGQDFTWDQMETMRAQMGLDAPWYQQYGRWMRAVVRGDLGVSAHHRMPVTQIIFGHAFWNTFRLSLTSMIIFFLIAIPLGILTGRYYRTFVDKTILLYCFIGAALPNVVLGLVLIFVFGIRLGWLPPIGSIDIFVVGSGAFREFMSRLQHLILPSMALATFSGVGMVYTLRAQIVDGRSSDYAMTARSKGVPERVIFNKHILRNSLIPFAQGIGFTFTSLFSGSVLLERIFRFPGMGALFLDSIMLRDYAVASGLILFYATLSVLAVLIGDIALAATDPRIRVR